MEVLKCVSFQRSFVQRLKSLYFPVSGRPIYIPYIVYIMHCELYLKIVVTRSLDPVRLVNRH